MEAELQALKVPDLKKLLQDANLPVSGTKAELIKRLLENPAATASLAGEEEDLLEEYEADAPVVAEASKEPPATTTTVKTAPAVTAPAKTEEASTPVVAPAEQSEEDQKAALVAELEKRKARAARWGLSTGEAEAKLERAIKFGVESKQTLSSLDGGLKGGKRREDKVEKKAADAGPKKIEKSVESKPVETEEEKAARIARQEADDAAKKRRAERFGLPAPTPAAATPVSPTKAAKSPSVDPAEEERKRKRMEKFGTAPSAEPADKKIKA